MVFGGEEPGDVVFHPYVGAGGGGEADGVEVAVVGVEGGGGDGDGYGLEGEGEDKVGVGGAGGPYVVFPCVVVVDQEVISIWGGENGEGGSAD